MKLGILGTGKIVQEVLTLCPAAGMEEVYLFARRESRAKAEALREQYGLSGVVYDYDELLAMDLDGVYVALPNHLHYAFAKRALEAGKHVLLEKPVTANPRELDDLISVGERKMRLLVEAMNIGFLPAFAALGQDVARLGRIRLAVMNYSQYSSRYEDFRRGKVQPAFDPARAGGALMDLNVYNLYALVGLFGAPDRVDYRANIQRGIDTSGIVTLSYPDFQAVAIGAKDCGADAFSTIQGEAGYIRLETPVNQLTGYTLCLRGQPPEERRFPKAHRLSYELQAFREMTETGSLEKARERMKTTREVSRVLYAARQSAGLVFPGD